MSDCVFCRIVSGEIPSSKVYEDDEVIAFRDIHPQAPLHVQIIPKRHIDNLTQTQEDDIPLLVRFVEQGLGVSIIPLIARAINSNQAAPCACDSAIARCMNSPAKLELPCARATAAWVSSSCGR